MSMSWGPADSYDILDGTRTSIKHVTTECNTLTTTASKVLYPDDVCERARSLYISGLFVSKVHSKCKILFLSIERLMLILCVSIDSDILLGNLGSQCILDLCNK